MSSFHFVKHPISPARTQGSGKQAHAHELKTLLVPVNGLARRDRSPGVSGPDYSGRQRLISPTSRRWDACSSTLQSSNEVARFNSTCQTVFGEWYSLSQRSWSNITQWWAGRRGGGVVRLGPFLCVTHRCFMSWAAAEYFCASALCLHLVLCVGSFTSCHPSIVIDGGRKKNQPSGFSFRQPHNPRYCCIHSLKWMIMRWVQLWWDYSSGSTVASVGDTCFKAPAFISLFILVSLSFFLPYSSDLYTPSTAGV